MVIRSPHRYLATSRHGNTSDRAESRSARCCNPPCVAGAARATPARVVAEIRYVPAVAQNAVIAIIDTGLRLRYEFNRKFAPYIGVVYEGKFGQTASLAKHARESTGDFRFAFGVRVWF